MLASYEHYARRDLVNVLIVDDDEGNITMTQEPCRNFVPGTSKPTGRATEWWLVKNSYLFGK